MITLYLLVLAVALSHTGVAATCYAPVSASDTPLCSSCGGGTCTQLNGCSCLNDLTKTCAPTTECSSVGTNICCPTGYFWSSTENCCTSTLVCIPSCNTDEMCQNVSNVATCNCNTTVYSGLTSSAIVPLKQCGASTITISVSKCLLVSLGYDPTSLRLTNSSDSCTSTFTQTINNVTMLSIQALPETGWCGNTVSSDMVKVNYSNVLNIGVKNQTVITASPVSVNFICTYNLTVQSSLSGAFKPILNTINITISGEGSVVSTMTAYSDVAYSKPILSNQEVTVGSFVYLGILSDAGDVNRFVQRVESCIATPDSNVNNPNKVSLVSGGCPANQGVSAEVQENGVSFQSRIKFNSFAFQGQPSVYITCTIRMCDRNKTCTGCNVARAADDSAAQLQIPILLTDYMTSASSTATSSAVLTSCLLLFLSVKFFF